MRLTTSGSPSGGISTLPMRVMAGLVLVACLMASRPAWAGTCSGPPALEARLHAHPEADAYAALGDWFNRNHQPSCAMETFQAGLKRAPGSAQLSFLLGLSLSTAGRWQEALVPLRQSIQLDPGNAQAHLALGGALSGLGHNKEALPEWEAALKIDPASKKALDGLAKSLIASGDSEAAIRRLGFAPRDENLTVDLSAAYRNAGQFDDAAQVLTEGLKTYPYSDLLTSALVSLYVHESHFAAASTLAEELARQKPRDLEAQRIYLRTLVITGNNELAAPLGRKLLTLAPHDADLLNLNGFLERKAGDYPAARKHLEESVRVNPDDYNSRVNLGLVLAQLADPSGAREQLEKAVELGATEPQVRFELAKVLRALGETEQAQQQLKLYRQKLKEESDQSLAVLKATEAAQAAKAGDNRKAADLYHEACAVQPDNAGLAYRLAMVLDDLGDLAGERAALEEAIKADPGFVSAQYQLGYMDFQAGDNAGAERQFRLTVEAVPGNAKAWVSLAATLGAQSRFQEAKDAVANALKIEPDNAAALALGKKLAAAEDQHER